MSMAYNKGQPIASRARQMTAVKAARYTLRWAAPLPRSPRPKWIRHAAHKAAPAKRPATAKPRPAVNNIKMLYLLTIIPSSPNARPPCESVGRNRRIAWDRGW